LRSVTGPADEGSPGRVALKWKTARILFATECGSGFEGACAKNPEGDGARAPDSPMLDQTNAVNCPACKISVL
jgi:hypothetical protein